MKKSGKFVALAQYLKSCGLENPNAPRIFIEKYPMPDVKVACDVSAKKLGKASYEVDLLVRADALIAVKDDDMNLAEGCTIEEGKVVAFRCNLYYGGLFNIAEGLDKDIVNRILLVYAPVLLFPFARRIMAGMTVDAGYPPLMLEAIDFEGKFNEQLESKDSKVSSKTINPDNGHSDVK